MIQFHNISKTYLGGQTALSDISFTLERSSMHFLTGHSGAGKSTILKLIMMIEQPTSGQIYIADKPITKISKRHIPYLRRRIGMIYQTPMLLEQATAFANAALPLTIEGYNHREIGRRVRAALDLVGLLDKEKYYPQALSSGEQQRLGIARAMVNRPPILLADEPTGNLDPALSLEIMNLFAKLNQVGITVLIATHDLDLTRRLNKPCITLHRGKRQEVHCHE